MFAPCYPEPRLRGLPLHAHPRLRRAEVPVSAFDATLAYLLPTACAHFRTTEDRRHCRIHAHGPSSDIELGLAYALAECVVAVIKAPGTPSAPSGRRRATTPMRRARYWRTTAQLCTQLVPSAAITLVPPVSWRLAYAGVPDSSLVAPKGGS